MSGIVKADGLYQRADPKILGVWVHIAKKVHSATELCGGRLSCLYRHIQVSRATCVVSVYYLLNTCVCVQH